MPLSEQPAVADASAAHTADGAALPPSALPAVAAVPSTTSDEPSLPVVRTEASRAWSVSERAAATGFDWPDLAAVREKLAEEVGELQAALDAGDHDGFVEELGDVLFTLVNVARFVPGGHASTFDDAFGSAIDRFEARRDRVMRSLAADGLDLRATDPVEVERRWRAAKSGEVGC